MIRINEDAVLSNSSKKSRDQTREKSSSGRAPEVSPMERRNTVAHGRNVVNAQLARGAPQVRVCRMGHNSIQFPQYSIQQGQSKDILGCVKKMTMSK